MYVRKLLHMCPPACCSLPRVRWTWTWLPSGFRSATCIDSLDRQTLLGQLAGLSWCKCSLAWEVGQWLRNMMGNMMHPPRSTARPSHHTGRHGLDMAVMAISSNSSIAHGQRNRQDSGLRSQDSRPPRLPRPSHLSARSGPRIDNSSSPAETPKRAKAGGVAANEPARQAQLLSRTKVCSLTGTMQ